MYVCMYVCINNNFRRDLELYLSLQEYYNLSVRVYERFFPKILGNTSLKSKYLKSWN